MTNDSTFISGPNYFILYHENVAFCFIIFFLFSSEIAMENYIHRHSQTHTHPYQLLCALISKSMTRLGDFWHGRKLIHLTQTKADYRNFAAQYTAVNQKQNLVAKFWWQNNWLDGPVQQQMKNVYRLETSITKLTFYTVWQMHNCVHKIVNWKCKNVDVMLSLFLEAPTNMGRDREKPKQKQNV